MQGVHSNVLLLLMLVVTGVSVYIAIEMRKRLNHADELINSIESVTENIVRKEDVDELKSLLVEDEPREEAETEAVASTSNESTDIKIIASKPKKRRINA